MKDQSLKSHAKFVPGFHFLSSALILASLVIAIILMVHSGVTHETVLYLLFALSLLMLFFFIRQFATRNQDRIIRAEENFRSFQLTGKPLDTRLTREQIVGLRFASDAEFVDLAKRAIAENLGQKEIKAAIQNWKADHHRV